MLVNIPYMEHLGIIQSVGMTFPIYGKTCSKPPTNIMIYQMENNSPIGLAHWSYRYTPIWDDFERPLNGYWVGLWHWIYQTKWTHWSQSDFPGSILFHYVGLCLLMKSQSTNLKWMKSDTFLLLMPYFHICSILWSHIKHNICIYIYRHASG